MTAHKMPTTVRVGTVTYTVSTDNDDWLKWGKPDHYGVTDHAAARILLDPAMAAAQQPLTLWHEVLHAMCETLMGSPTWKIPGDEDAREERVVRMLEHPTMQIMRDNPALLAYLVD